MSSQQLWLLVTNRTFRSLHMESPIWRLIAHEKVCKTMYCLLLKRMQLTFTAWVNRSCQKHVSVSLHDLLYTGRNLLGVAFITSLKSNLYTTVPHRTPQKITVLSHTQKPRYFRDSIPAGTRHSYRLQRIQTGSGAHPASCSMGIKPFFPGVKRPEREADHSHPFSAEVKDEWSYTSAPLCAFMAWTGITLHLPT
jgi:hypothetical protein